MKRRPSHEVDFVASFIETASSRLESEWQNILAPDRIQVRVAGVFCHQSPLVQIKGKPLRPVPSNRCELADLLVLHSHARSDRKIFWRGVLMQAKLNNAKKIVPDEPQLWLYQDWPGFKIISPGFHDHERNFHGDQRSGRYGLVSSNGWQVLAAGNPLIPASPSSSDLGEFLVKMLYDMDPDQVGRTSQHGKQVYDQSGYDWSPTIWELVRITAAKALRHKGRIRGVYDRDLNRLGGGVLEMTLAFASRHLATPPVGADVEDGEGEENGISLLVIETRSEREIAT